MKKRNLSAYSRFLSGGQTGQALILVLVFLMLGSILLVPALDRLGTALKTNIKYEEKSNALYAADAGIEDGIWQIKYGGLQSKFGGEDAFEYIFAENATYILDNQVNYLTTNVTVSNIWIPSNVTLGELGLTAADAKSIIEDEKLVVSGTSGAVPGQPFHIKIDFVPVAGDNLTIKSVGVWLSQGFSYTMGSSSLEDTGHTYTKIPTVTDSNGGEAIVWSYSSPYPLFTDFPSFVSENGTMTSTISFNYSPPPANPNKMPAGTAWVTTEMYDGSGNPRTNDVPIAWDVDTRFYKISATAGNTTVEAYLSKHENRDLSEAVSGDYVAIGNSLMIGDVTQRDVLLASSSTEVSNIPEDADVRYAYLYWSGFKHATTVFSDDCSNYYNWSRSLEDTQTRVPTGDGDIDGTWNTAPSWDDVDETIANDADFMTGVDGSYKLFTFANFTVQAGTAITDLTVYVRAKDASSGTNNIRQYIKVNSNRYEGSSYNPGSSFITYGYGYTTNPDTGAAWTVDDLNGAGANPLQQFGAYSSDLNPDVQISMLYATATDSRWTIYNSDEFRGQGSSNATTAQRTLTLKNSLDLSSYDTGTAAIKWTQRSSGTLESDDALYYAVSGDGGTTWSSNYEAFHDDRSSTTFYFVVPEGYYTNNFKVRFYFNLNDTAEYAYVEDLAVYYMPPDTSVTFSIDGQQVYLDSNGDPQAGAQPLTADTHSALYNTAGTSSPGFSFACRADVSELVKKYPVVEGEEHHAGNADYTVGDLQADTGEYVSYAGWSLIIIYFSPETAGHYLYLQDIFAFNPGGVNLDFDGDGQSGGDITGFVIPEPIRDRYGQLLETTAASITCFVGEGDGIYTGDSLEITGEQSGASIYLSNSASPTNNVWNGASPGCSYPGIDVDTFVVLWDDNILTPNDTRLHLDMVSGTDAWNLIYVIVSVRSKTIVGGTDSYIITSN